MGQIQSKIMCNSVLLLYVYARNNYLQCKINDYEGVYYVCMCVSVLSVSERSKVVSESSV